MAYKLTPEEKKSIVVIETLKKTIRNKSCQFTAVTRWYGGYVLVENQPPEQTASVDEGSKVWADELDVIDQDFYDGNIEYKDFSENLTALEKERILNTEYLDLEEKGWEIDDSEIWLLGKLMVEEVEREKKPVSSGNPWANLV